MCFSTDVIHSGHIAIIKKARKLGKIIIGVLSDEAVSAYKRAPIMPFEERKILFENIVGVDKVVEQKTLSYKDVLKELKPTYVVHGDDWKNGVQKSIREEVIEFLSTYGGILVEHPYSKEEKYAKIENLKNYIIIQKLRYGDLFETNYQIDDDVKHCRIMKFLLQPIVENSILHAFEEDKEHQMLHIKAVHRDSFLEIEIADNGKGFSTEESITKTRLSGIGIHNIEERIKLMYGDKFSMQIQSEVGTGTITTLRLPYIVQNRK
jgi:cytidyltransferase-like protein